MTDEIDQANRLAEMERTASASHRKPEPRLRISKHCHWCGEPLQQPGRFCDRHCADDYERDWLANAVTASKKYFR